MKLRITKEKLFQNLPLELQEFYEYVMNLEF